MPAKGQKHTPEALAKLRKPKRDKSRMGQYWKGRKHSAESRAKMSEAKVGRTLTPEHAAKIGAALLGKKRPEQGAKMRGRKLTPETRAKMRDASNRRPPVTQAHRIALATSHGGYDDETFHKIWGRNCIVCGRMKIRWHHKRPESLEKYINRRTCGDENCISHLRSRSGGNWTAGRSIPEERKIQISASTKGVPKSPSARANMAKAQRYRHAHRKMPNASSVHNRSRS